MSVVAARSLRSMRLWVTCFLITLSLLLLSDFFCFHHLYRMLFHFRCRNIIFLYWSIYCLKWSFTHIIAIFFNIFVMMPCHLPISFTNFSYFFIINSFPRFVVYTFCVFFPDVLSCFMMHNDSFFLVSVLAIDALLFSSWCWDSVYSSLIEGSFEVTLKYPLTYVVY